MYTRRLVRRRRRRARSGRVGSAPMKIVYTHTDEAPALATAVAAADPPRLRGSGRRRDRAARHLAGRPDPGPVPRPPRRRAADRRRPGRARRAGRDARGQHHQAAEHQRLGAAAEGGDRRAAGAGLRRSPTTRRSRPTTSSARSARATTRSRAARSTRCCARATPTAARRPRSRSTRASTRTRWASGQRQSRSHVATMSDGDFRSHRAVGDGRARDGAVRIEHVRGRRRGDRAQGRDRRSSAGEVLDAAVMRRAALDAVPRRAGRRGQGPGRAVLGAPEGDDDEGVRPDHLRPRRAGVLRGRVRRARRRAASGGRQSQRRAGRAAEGDRGAPGRASATPSGRDRGGLRATAPRWRWSTPTAASPTCTCRAT